MDVARDPATLADAAREHRELVLEQDDVGDPLGDLAARAHRHGQPGLLERRDVVDAVADHPGEPALLREGADKRLLLVRGDAAEDRVALGGGGEALVVGGELGPLDDARVARHADRVRDRRHGLAGVARDQLEVHVLLAQELDRLGGVGAQLLLEHDQRAGLERRWRLAARIARKRPAGLGEGDDAPARGGVLLERPLERRAIAAGRRRRRGRPARPARSWRARRARRASARSTSTPTRTGPPQGPAPACRDSARRSSRACGSARRPSARTARERRARPWAASRRRPPPKPG